VPAEAAVGEVPAAEVSVMVSAPVAAVLRHARTPIVFGRLHEYVAGAFPAASADAVGRMLSGLVWQGFLVTELQPPMTSTDPLAHVVQTAGRAGAGRDPAAAAVVAELEAVRDLLARHDGTTQARAGMSRRELRGDAVTRMRGLARMEKPLGVDLRVDAEVSVPRCGGRRGGRRGRRAGAARPGASRSAGMA
jgi:hypothetical protein